MNFKIYAFFLFLNLILAALPLPAKDVDIWAETAIDNAKNDYLSRLPRVLNFFPVPFVEECKAKDGRRRGICMNTYECRIQEGKSHGFCALGFGVCCIFTATCGQEIYNNLTYFVNPDFPDLTKNASSCKVKVKKLPENQVTQIRLDFVHFNLGQPNRQTGVCEQDKFSIIVLKSEFTLCGLNSGQHVYFDVANIDEIEISVDLSKKVIGRHWEMIVTQLPFSQQSPPGCLQYFTGRSGVISTMNFAENGRHLANQDYNICIRQEEGMCSIAYEPCHEKAFRIAPNSNKNINLDTNNADISEGSGEIMEERSTKICQDKIVLPCDFEELLMPFSTIPISCTLDHCGNNLCPFEELPCRIESSVTPFNIGVHFGRNIVESSPEDNLGMCLIYEQIPCEE